MRFLFVLIFLTSGMVFCQSLSVASSNSNTPIYSVKDSLKNDTLTAPKNPNDFRSESKIATVGKVGLVFVWLIGGLILIAYYALHDNGVFQ